MCLYSVCQASADASLLMQISYLYLRQNLLVGTLPELWSSFSSVSHRRAVMRESMWQTALQCSNGPGFECNHDMATENFGRYVAGHHLTAYWKWKTQASAPTLPDCKHNLNVRQSLKWSPCFWHVGKALLHGRFLNLLGADRWNVDVTLACSRYNCCCSWYN